MASNWQKNPKTDQNQRRPIVMRAVGYTRLSQDSDTSIEDQKKDIKEYCKNRDWELVKIFNEGENVSGFNEDREKYQEMKSKMKVVDIDAVVVRDRARLGRDVDEKLRFVLDLRENDIELHVTEEGHVSLDDPFDLVYETMHSASDDKKKREEIKKAKKKVRERIENGYYHGPPPFGLKYDEDGKYLVPGEDFEKALDVIELREEEDLSYTEIEEKTGVPTSTASRIINERKDLYKEKERKKAN